MREVEKLYYPTSWIPRSSHVGAQSGTHLVHLNGFSPWLVLLMNLKVAWCPLKFLEVTRSYISTEALSHLPSALECPFSGGVLLCYFKSFDPENLLAHFCTKKCFSPVWFSHFSSIHLILRSSWQTLYTHSFSTVGVLLLLPKSFDE